MKPAKQGCSPQRSGGVEGSGDIRVSRRICVNMNIDRQREREREREREDSAACKALKGRLYGSGL